MLLYDLMTAHHRSVCMRIMEVTLHVTGRSRCPKQGATVSLRLKSVQIKIRDMAQMKKFLYFKRYIGHRCVREAPRKKLQGLFGHCPNGAGGLIACPDGLGHLFREDLSMFKGAFACFGWV